MSISIVPGNFIVNPVVENGRFCISNFLLGMVRFVNSTGEKIELCELSFEVFAVGKPVKKIIYSGEALALRIANGKDSLMLPGEEVIIRKEHFSVVSGSAVDMLDVKVSYRQSGEKSEHLSIPVVNYKTQNNYIFPVRGGGWQVNGNYDCLGAHRIPAMASMEFSIDLGLLNSENQYEWNGSMKNEDALCYGQDIIAIGDGEVVECYNTADWRALPSNDPESDWVRIGKQFGQVPLHCGNYVILRHDHDEYSLYGHMIPHSVTVEKGMHVKQRDVLGKLGNVGFSNAPHLHFHLMDSPELFKANGLPCHFTNIIDMAGRPLSLIQEEYTIVFAK
jgi:hypothetical protein